MGIADAILPIFKRKPLVSVSALLVVQPITGFETTFSLLVCIYVSFKVHDILSAMNMECNLSSVPFFIKATVTFLASVT